MWIKLNCLDINVINVRTCLVDSAFFIINIYLNLFEINKDSR